MKVKIKKVRDVGACSYCDKGELQSNGLGLEYPYTMKLLKSVVGR